MTKIVALVPVKKLSERVPNKNFREFGPEKSLFSKKIEQLASSDLIDTIYVSTNCSSLALPRTDQVTVLSRDEKFCNNQTPWAEMIAAIVSDIPEPDETLLVWAHTTVPFFSRFDEAIREYRVRNDSGKFDSLVATSVVKQFLISPDGHPVNYQWGKWHVYSQKLPQYRAVSGGVFVIPLGVARDLGYLIGRDPFFFDTVGNETLDIDTPAEFEFAQWLEVSHLSEEWR